MKTKPHFYVVLLLGIVTKGQVGINTTTPHPSALLDLNSSNKGLLLPRVPLLSTTDVATIPNPASGLMVYATQDSGSGNTAIQKDTLYKFDGIRWKALTTREELLTTDMPRIVAVGRKTTEEGCVGISNGWFNLNQRSNPSLISARGALTAPQDGYYMFSVRLTELMPASGQDLELGPYIRAKDLVTYTYRYRGNGNTSQIASILGTVYLVQGQTTPDFQWFLGDNTCTSTNFIRGQEVIWEYLGNPL